MKITLETIYRTIVILSLIIIWLLIYIIFQRNYDNNIKITYIYNSLKEFDLECKE